MAREGLRNKLRAAIQQASQEHALAIATGAQASYGGSAVAVRIEVHPVQSEARICCWSASSTNPSASRGRPDAVEPAADLSRIAELERELDATRKELQSAIHELEIANEEQKAINEEAMSVERGVPVDQRGADDLAGGAAVAQRRAHRAQQSASGDARTPAQYIQRPAEHPGQLRRCDPVPGQRAQHPLLHAGGQIAVPRHRHRHRPAARRPGPPHQRHSPARRRRRGACRRRAAEPRGRGRQRSLVHPSHPALPHPGRSGRRGGYHLRRHIREENGRTGNRGGAVLFRQHHRHHSPAARRARRGALRHLREPLLLQHLFGRA